MIVADVPRLLDRLGIRAQRRGREWWACCPLHEEQTPSWQIRDDVGDLERHGRWRCLGQCHTGGSPVGLVMQLFELSSGDAARWLRSEAAAPASLGAITFRAAARPRLGMTLPAGVVIDALEEWVTPARAYAGTRGLTEEQVDRWNLGYAVDGRLAGRLVLPVYSAAGRLLNYTARSFQGAAKKYLEPSAAEGGDKGAIFGEEHWPIPAQREGVAVYVLEGAFDALAVERALPDSAVAAVYGSQLLAAHVAKLSTFGELVIATDPDGSGEKFADRLEAAVTRWKPVRRVRLPRGNDAAKIECTRGPLALAELLTRRS